MAEIKRLIDRVKRLHNNNRLSVMIFVDDDEVRVSYFIEGAISDSGGKCFSNRNAVDCFISGLMEKYHIFSENCYIWELINDLEE